MPPEHSAVFIVEVMMVQMSGIKTGARLSLLLPGRHAPLSMSALPHDLSSIPSIRRLAGSTQKVGFSMEELCFIFFNSPSKGCHSCKNLSWDLILTFCRRQVLENIRSFTSGLDSQNRNDPKIEFQGMILIYSLIFEPLSMFQLPKIGQSNNQRPDSFILCFPFGQVYTSKV